MYKARFEYIFIFLFCFFSTMFAENFVVGTTSGYAPYVSLDDTGEYVGFDIDVAKELSQRLDRPLQIKDYGSMPALLLALKQGKVDVVIWAVSITEERKEKFSMIYYQGPQVCTMPLLYFQKLSSDIHEIAAVKDYTLVVEAGSYQESVLEKSGVTNLKRVDKVLDAILQIKYGKADATMIDPALVEKYQSQFPDLKVLWVTLNPSLQSLGNGICCQKTNTALIKKLEEAVDGMLRDQTIVCLEKKWNLEGK